jgi:SAM-dependent methyltransferase
MARQLGGGGLSRAFVSFENAYRAEVTVDDARVRHRQGTAHMVDGIPLADAASTLSLLPAAAVGQWLATHTRLLHGRLLDNGCGNQPFRTWYEPHVDEVVALDATPSSGVSVLGFADRLPFPAHTFGTVLATEILEHVENAERAASEMFRVLRPGGHALVTVPYLYPTHEAPFDFRRFTHFGLANLLERHGFEVLDLRAKGGPGVMLLHYVVLAASQALGGQRSSWFRRGIAGPQQIIVRRRQIHRQPTGGCGILSLGYMAAVRKPIA